MKNRRELKAENMDIINGGFRPRSKVVVETLFEKWKKGEMDEEYILLPAEISGKDKTDCNHFVLV